MLELCCLLVLLKTLWVKWRQAAWHVSATSLEGIPAEKSSSLMNKWRGQIHFSFTQNPLSPERCLVCGCVVNLQTVQKKHNLPSTHMHKHTCIWVHNVYSKISHKCRSTQPPIELWTALSSDRQWLSDVVKEDGLIRVYSATWSQVISQSTDTSTTQKKGDKWLCFS